MSAVGGCGLVEDVSDLLGAVVGDFDTDMRLICREGLTESFLLAGGACVCEARRRSRMWQEGIACASAVFGRVLLDAAAYLTWGITGECDDVKGAAHAGCVLGAGQVMVFLLSLEGGSSIRDSHSRAEVLSALGQPVLVHGARPARGQVHSSGPWDDPSRESDPRCR